MNSHLLVASFSKMLFRNTQVYTNALFLFELPRDFQGAARFRSKFIRNSRLSRPSIGRLHSALSVRPITFSATVGFSAFRLDVDRVHRLPMRRVTKQSQTKYVSPPVKILVVYCMSISALVPFLFPLMRVHVRKRYRLRNKLLPFCFRFCCVRIKTKNKKTVSRGRTLKTDLKWPRSSVHGV